MNNDNVNKPQHYCYGKYECIDVLQDILKDVSGVEAFCIGNAIKYLWRYKHKNGEEDLKKARWYLDKAIQLNEDKIDFQNMGTAEIENLIGGVKSENR